MLRYLQRRRLPRLVPLKVNVCLQRSYANGRELPEIEPKRPTGGARLWFRSLFILSAIGGATLLASGGVSSGKDSSEEASTKAMFERKLPDYGTLSLEQISSVLEQNQVTFKILDERGLLPGGAYTPVTRFDNNSVASNSPIEDYHVEHMHDGKALFAIFDGHAGRDCARILSRYFASYVFSELKSSTLSVSSKADAIKRAYLKLDADIVNGGISLPDPTELQLSAAAVEQTSGKIRKVANSLTGALAGSCAISALLDGNSLFVACTGDSRVVLGRERFDGTLEAVALSEDQTAKNTGEMRRMMEEHPGEEKTLFRRNRVLGGLMPTRAFGDARYKWSMAVQDALFAFIPARRKSPDSYLTPPYVTAEPVVTYHELSACDKFMVMGSDGLYDELTNEEIVGIVAESLRLDASGRKDLESPSYRGGRFQWTFVDSNTATLLIRNALGGRDAERTGRLLAMPYPVSRNHRDDITVTVVFFDAKDTPATARASAPSSLWSLWSYLWPFSRTAVLPPGLSSVNMSLASKKEPKLDEYVKELEVIRNKLTNSDSKAQ